MEPIYYHRLEEAKRGLLEAAAHHRRAVGAESEVSLIRVRCWHHFAALLEDIGDMLAWEDSLACYLTAGRRWDESGGTLWGEPEATLEALAHLVPSTSRGSGSGEGQGTTGRPTSPPSLLVRPAVLTNWLASPLDTPVPPTVLPEEGATPTATPPPPWEWEAA